MRFTSDFWIKKQDASDIKAGTLDGMATDSNLRRSVKHLPRPSSARPANQSLPSSSNHAQEAEPFTGKTLTGTFIRVSVDLVVVA